jgi:hypothetical protein
MVIYRITTNNIEMLLNDDIQLFFFQMILNFKRK